MEPARRRRGLAANDDGAEVIVDSPATRPVTAMRSTVLVALRAASRDMGFYDEYQAKLDPKHAHDIEHMVAAAWVPVEIVQAHYAACDALGLPVREQIAVGAAAAERIVNALIGTALRIASAAGTTPWGFIAQVGRFWGRGYEGGGIRILKKGPKEAHVLVLENDIHHRSGFARQSFVGVCQVLFKPFCTRFLMRVDAVGELPDETVRYVTQWV